jgi:uncharacterized protein YbaA (DUF1428 family)
MSYVDGFVLPLPKKNVAKYKKIASVAAKIWIKHGALHYMECVGDDLKVPMGLPYPTLLKLKPTETAVFAFIVYKSRAHRDKVNKKVMSDPGLICDPNNMPFDCSKMAWGGFTGLVEGKAKKK